MKRFILFTVIITLLSVKSYSQSEPKLFYFGAGVGFGFFYPTDVNNMINNYYSNAMEVVGTFDMIMYYVLNVKGSFFFSRYTELQLEAEWGFSPKFVMINDETDIHFYRRITPALKFNLHLPVGEKASIYFGPGISWNSLRFNLEDGTYFKNSCIGYSGQAGVMIRFTKWAIAPFIVANFIHAEDSETENPLMEFIGADLNFTGVQLGNTFYF